MSGEKLDLEWIAALANATGAVMWVVHPRELEFVIEAESEDFVAECTDERTAAFVAAAHRAIPALIARVRELNERLRGCRECGDSLRQRLSQLERAEERATESEAALLKAVARVRELEAQAERLLVRAEAAEFELEQIREGK